MKYLLPLLVVLVVVILSQILFPKIVQIQQVDCVHKSGGECSSELMVRLAGVGGTKLNEARNLVSGILNEDPKVLGYSTSYVPLNGLKVEVEVRSPSVAISSLKHQDVYALVDSQGYVLEFKNETSLPKLIITSAPPNLGEQLESGWVFSIEVAQLVSTAMGINEVYVENDGLYFYLPTGTKVWLDRQGDPRSLITSLQVILSQSKIIDDFGGNPKEIDLRFSNPIIR